MSCSSICFNQQSRYLLPCQLNIWAKSNFRQAALNGKLSFIKRSQKIMDEQASLASAVQSNPALDAVINELLDKSLIKKENRVISVHRVVQEAMNYHSLEDLQASFDAAVALVGFPRDYLGRFQPYNVCVGLRGVPEERNWRAYVQRVAYLPKLYLPRRAYWGQVQRIHEPVGSH
jgi:hypothetical protein